jgi:hypothetical protein
MKSRYGTFRTDRIQEETVLKTLVPTVPTLKTKVLYKKSLNAYPEKIFKIHRMNKNTC